MSILPSGPCKLCRELHCAAAAATHRDAGGCCTEQAKLLHSLERGARHERPSGVRLPGSKRAVVPQRASAIADSDIFRINKDRLLAADTADKFPERPDSDVLGSSIPLFFITRNKIGLWIAREAEGHTGGIFLFKRSALRFAKTSSGASGCATMSLANRLELDIENRGSRLVAWVAALLKLLTR
jgi:hypothetical protein